MRIGSPSRVLLLAMLPLVGGCGESAGPSQKATPAHTADEALALAREADEAGRIDARRDLLEEASRDSGEAGRIATTWLLSLDLERHDPAAALARLDRIDRTFGGSGREPNGRALPSSILAGALVDEAAAAARRLVEGPTPDGAAAERALDAGRKALDRTEMAPADLSQIEAAARYLALRRERDVVEGDLVAHAKGRVIVFADHFQLLEPILPSVLKRWNRGVRVEVVGLVVGRVREGIRRVPAPEKEERAVLSARIAALGLHLRSTLAFDAPAAHALGLERGGATVFVFDPSGALVGRASGAALDPRVLDPVVTRLEPSVAPEPDPTEKPR